MSVTVEQVRDYLRYDTTDNDPALTIMLESAKGWVERYTGHLLTSQTVEESFSSFAPYHDLRWKPYLADSATVTYLDEDYTEQTFGEVSIYAANGTQRLVPTTAWPSTNSGAKVAYTAGYADPADIPDEFIHAIVLFCAMSDEDRAGLTNDGRNTLHWLLASYRLPVLA